MVDWDKLFKELGIMAINENNRNSPTIIRPLIIPKKQIKHSQL
jgi:hypothetical protein